jgi:hypothetical protein
MTRLSKETTGFSAVDVFDTLTNFLSHSQLFHILHKTIVLLSQKLHDLESVGYELTQHLPLMILMAADGGKDLRFQ